MYKRQAEQEGASQTLDALRRVKDELGLKTVLGVSNISFGLPARPLVNQTFLTMAMTCGLDLPILNPNTDAMICLLYTSMEARSLHSMPAGQSIERDIRRTYPCPFHPFPGGYIPRSPRSAPASWPPKGSGWYWQTLSLIHIWRTKTPCCPDHHRWYF